MKLKNVILTGVSALSFGMIVSASPASASTWHSSSIPAKLRGTWYSIYTNHTLKIGRHSFKYSGEKTAKHVKWKYKGNNSYSFKGRGAYTNTFVHYINSHRLSAYSMDHSYRR